MNTEYKGFAIVHDGTYGYKEVKAIGKGSVNKVLRGKYTNANMAQRDIDRFLSTQEKKPVKKGIVKDDKID